MRYNYNYDYTYFKNLSIKQGDVIRHVKGIMHRESYSSVISLIMLTHFSHCQSALYASS